jgi:hypothetical protein
MKGRTGRITDIQKLELDEGRDSFGMRTDIRTLEFE